MVRPYLIAIRAQFVRPSGAGAVWGPGSQGSVRCADFTLGYSRVLPLGETPETVRCDS